MTISNMSLFGLFGWMWCFWWMILLLFWGGLCNGKKQYLFLFDIEWITSCRNIYAACWGWRYLPLSFHISNNDFISVFRIGLPSDFMCHSAEKADMVKDIFFTFRIQFLKTWWCLGNNCNEKVAGDIFYIL